MKKKISKIVLAVSMTAASVSAQGKIQSLESSQKASDSPHSIKKRLANKLRRMNRQKAEAEYIRELEADIHQALTRDINKTKKEDASIKAEQPIVVHYDSMPITGIDISKEFNNYNYKQ